jgi:hypothetical protein
VVNFTMLTATRPRLVKQALQSIGDLNDVSVTVRDEGINDIVGEAVRSWCARTYCAASYTPGGDPIGTGPARNQVIGVSEHLFHRGDYLYCSDDDVYFLQPDWLKVLTTAYDQAWEKGFRVIGGVGHPYHRPIAPTTRLECRWGVDEIFALPLQSMLMRWEVWDKYGPFDDTPPGRVCMSEDTAFCNAIRADGCKVGVIAPALIVNCGITNSFGEKIPGWDLVKNEAPPGVLVE